MTEKFANVDLHPSKVSKGKGEERDRPHHEHDQEAHKTSTPEPPVASSMTLYQSEDGQTRVQCRFEEGTIWLSQRLISDLFQVTAPAVNEHLSGIYAHGELEAGATIRRFRIVQTEGSRQVTREVEHYNLPAILAVGYRVRSLRGMQFRQWASARLEEYLVKGFTMDDQRLKNPPGPDGPDYFDELLERIRDIRASERRMYLRVRDNPGAGVRLHAHGRPDPGRASVRGE